MKKIVLSLLFFAFILLLSACEKEPEEEENTYRNPVFEPIFADPAVIRDEDGTFYVYGTQDYGEWGDLYETAYGPILKSENLVDWEYAGSVFTLANRPAWGTPNAGVWAPDVVKIKDQYVYYYSLSKWGDPNPGIGIATAPHLLGPWTDHGKLFDSLSIGVNNSIDPSVFLDDKGNVYMIWGSFRGLYGIELTEDGLGLKGGPESKVHIAGLDTSTPWNGSTYEASYVIKKDGFYYLFVSSGTCCNGFASTYNVRVARSTNPLGPYYDDQGRSMLAAGRGYQVLTGSSFFAGPGHNSIVVDDAGDYWIMYHAYDKSKPEKLGHTNRRCLMLDKLVWTSDGWPSLNGTMPSNTPKEKPYIKK